ncbi:MAG TPA: CBS domain-containing protein [Gemmatimonadaceae bacterium]|nr:CBS domain-containing protein [Gemmatimonadaceae bacterium]
MIAHPSVVAASDSIAAAGRIMRDRRIGLLPVVDGLPGKHLRGVITDHDIVVRCVAAGHDVSRCTVGNHMTAQGLVSVAPMADAGAVAATMESAKLRRIPVVADDGRLVGLISFSDLAGRIGPRDPDLVVEVEQILMADRAHEWHDARPSGLERETTRARDVMTPNPTVVAAGASVMEAADLMRTAGVSLLPVVADVSSGIAIGVITDRDIVERIVAAGRSPNARVRDHMSASPIEWLTPADDIASVKLRMKTRHIERVLVIDGGRLVGIITHADLVTRVPRTVMAPREFAHAVN